MFNRFALCMSCGIRVLCCGETASDVRVSFSILGHSVSVFVQKTGKMVLKADGKEGRKDRDGLPYVTFAGITVGLERDGSLTIEFGGNGDDELYINVVPTAQHRPAPKTAKKMSVGKKVVMRDKSTYGGDAETPVVCYDFYYSVVRAGLAYEVFQTNPTSTMTKEFREVLGSLKIERMEK